ncbi:hypothetical protein J2X12_000615 [Pseudarthrobacter oxydans]|uniref:Uncharacterized protein n=1 Tax=Pseudarthrobacter oxydans TaxID=1671 RepID=A0AAW8N8C6_PSEOX|nr:hypothetical protein [Pseudarthrobacter oxydans]
MTALTNPIFNELQYSTIIETMSDIGRKTQSGSGLPPVVPDDSKAAVGDSKAIAKTQLKRRSKFRSSSTTL